MYFVEASYAKGILFFIILCIGIINFCVVEALSFCQGKIIWLIWLKGI